MVWICASWETYILNCFSGFACYWITRQFVKGSVYVGERWIDKRGRLRNENHSPLAILSFFFLSLSSLYLLTVECKGLLLHLITVSNTQSVRHPWTRVWPEAATSPWQHTTQTNIHTPGAIRTRSPNERAVADLHLSPRGHWDRLASNSVLYFWYISLLEDVYILLGARTA